MYILYTRTHTHARAQVVDLLRFIITHLVRYCGYLPICVVIFFLKLGQTVQRKNASGVPRWNVIKYRSRSRAVVRGLPQICTAGRTEIKTEKFKMSHGPPTAQVTKPTQRSYFAAIAQATDAKTNVNGIHTHANGNGGRRVTTTLNDGHRTIASAADNGRCATRSTHFVAPEGGGGARRPTTVRVGYSGCGWSARALRPHARNVKLSPYQRGSSLLSRTANRKK